VKHWLFVGEVLHRRVKPVANAFRYRVFFLKFPLHRMAELSNAVFSVNRFNLLSFHHADHGDGGDPLAWVRALLAREGVADADGEVWLQCFPRVLGYVFNPVSFWYCHRADGALRAVVAEVNNTFGERHCYLLESRRGGTSGAAEPRAPAPAIKPGQLLIAPKVFHVSPFCAIEGGYRFRFIEGDARTVARIDHHDSAGDLLHTSVSGAARRFSAGSLLAAFFGHPLMTFGVVARIHWQALRLWCKRVPFHRKPTLPSEFVTR
jgi:DUF1365 family protein